LPDPADAVGCAAIQFSTSTGEIVYTFSNMFVDDLMADLLKLFLYMTVMVVCSIRVATSWTASR
jgi:hypothetical protein